MKCPACGREMVNRGSYFDCPNILCDYEEEIESDGLPAFIKTCYSNSCIGDQITKEAPQCF